MDYQSILGFFTASFLLALLPGPDNIFVLTESLTNGFRAGMYLVLGLASGVLVHTTAAATGMSLIIKHSPSLYNAIIIFGVLYLLYLAYGSWKETNVKANIEISAKRKNVSLFRQWRIGFFMNVLNPKVTLFFIAFLPQFIDNASNVSPILQMFLLGFVFILVTIISFGSIAYFAGTIRSYFDGPNFWLITNWSRTIVLFGMAVCLAVF